MNEKLVEILKVETLEVNEKMVGMLKVHEKAVEILQEVVEEGAVVKEAVAEEVEENLD